MSNKLRELAKRAANEASDLGLIAGFLHLVRIILLIICFAGMGITGTLGSTQTAAILLAATGATIASYKNPPLLGAALALVLFASVTDHGRP